MLWQIIRLIERLVWLFMGFFRVFLKVGFLIFGSFRMGRKLGVHVLDALVVESETVLEAFFRVFEVFFRRIQKIIFYILLEILKVVFGLLVRRVFFRGVLANLTPFFVFASLLILLFFFQSLFFQVLIQLSKVHVLKILKLFHVILKREPVDLEGLGLNGGINFHFRLNLFLFESFCFFHSASKVEGKLVFDCVIVEKVPVGHFFVFN